jgi:hypothetical protein
LFILCFIGSLALVVLIALPGLLCFAGDPVTAKAFKVWLPLLLAPPVDSVLYNIAVFDALLFRLGLDPFNGIRPKACDVLNPAGWLTPSAFPATAAAYSF